MQSKARCMLSRCDSWRGFQRWWRQTTTLVQITKTLKRALTCKYQECKDDKKEITYEKENILKMAMLKSRPGSTIDYWVSIFSSEVFFSQQISESQTKMISGTTVLSSILWVESLNPEQPVMAHTFHSCFLSFMLEVSFCVFGLWGHTVWSWVVAF